MPEELEKPCRVYPYDDDYMVFDPVFGRYVLTENALLHAGINLRARIARDSGVSAEDVIRSVCECASDAVYGYIHDFSVDNCAQDMAIARLPPFRPVMHKVLVMQAKYMLAVGNLYLSTDPNDLARAVNELAKKELGRVIPGYGSVLYAGVRR